MNIKFIFYFFFIGIFSVFSNNNHYYPKFYNKYFFVKKNVFIENNIEKKLIQKYYTNLYTYIPYYTSYNDLFNQSKIIIYNNNILIFKKKKKFNYNNILLIKLINNNINYKILINPILTSFSVKNINKNYYDNGYLDNITKVNFELKKNNNNKIIYNNYNNYILNFKYFKYKIKNKYTKLYKKIIFNNENIKFIKYLKFNNYKLNNKIKKYYIHNNKNYYYNYNYNLNDIYFNIYKEIKNHNFNLELNFHFNKKFFFLKKKIIYNKIKIKFDNTLNNNIIIYNRYNFFYPKKKVFYLNKIINAIQIKSGNIICNKNILLSKKNIFNLKKFKILFFDIQSQQKINNNQNINFYIHLNKLKKYNFSFFIKNEKIFNKYFNIITNINFIIRNILNYGKNIYITIYNNLYKQNIFNYDIFFPKIILQINNFYIKNNNNIQSIINTKFHFHKKLNIKNYYIYKIYNNYYQYNIFKIWDIQLLNNYYINNFIYKNKLNIFFKKKLFIFYINKIYLKKIKYFFYNIKYNQINHFDINNNILIHFFNIKKKYNNKKYFSNIILYKYKINELLNYNNINPLILFFQFKIYNNIFNIINNIFNHIINNKILNIKYYQYFKFNLDINKYWFLNKKQSLKSYLFIGINFPFNYKYLFIYHKKKYNNNIRSRDLYNLGPGKIKKKYNYLSFSDIKIFTNIEYRLKYIKNCFLTLFLDIGNLWNINSKINYSNFTLKNFYKEFSIVNGIGIYYNIKFLILKLDFVYKILNPINKTNFFTKKKLINPIINIKFEYPF